MGYYRGSGAATKSRYVTKKPYYKKTKTEYTEAMEMLEKQKEMFTLEVILENVLEEFRDMVIEWEDERVTLDEVLGEMARNSLCRRMSVWA